MIEVHVRFASGHPGRAPATLSLPEGSTFREVLGRLGLPVEGTALFWEGEPVPSDARVERSGELEVVSTFSGG